MPAEHPRIEQPSHLALAATMDGSSYDPVELGYDTMDGLTRPFKELSSRFLYDERGAEIFEEILKLPEYYQTRTEIALLKEYGSELLSRYQPHELVDLGSGSGEKSALLLSQSDPGQLPTYVPVDTSAEMLEGCTTEMRQRFPTLDIKPVKSDFNQLEELLGAPKEGQPRFIAMFGGTIGNLPPGTRRRFLSSLAAVAGEEGLILVGVDLLKDPRRIELAYDDAAGVTAEFNRNILQTLNERLGANFDLDAFDHLVVFDGSNEWIEMRLRARRACTVRFELLDWQVDFTAGEEIRTEISAKFSRESFEREAAWSGLQLKQWITDPENQFAIPILGRTTDE